MKKLFLFLAILAVAGCQQQKKEIARLGSLKDSLVFVTAGKDSTILDFLMAFNEIQENLDSIKRLEQVVTVAGSQRNELTVGRKQQIMDDIRILNQLIQKNKELNASLQKKLNSATSKIGQLQGMITEFERMVYSLNLQLEQKDLEIAALNRDIARLNIDIGQLTGEVLTARQEVQDREVIIREQTDAMNQVFFAIGNVKELTDNGILEKSGGILGLGRTLKIRKDFNREYFTPGDMRELTFIPLHAKKVKVISVHPADAYRISGNKSADTLFIEDSREFWKASRYLLLVVD